MVELELHLMVPAGVPSQRIDTYLTTVNPGRSRALFQHAIENGWVLLNGKTCRRSNQVHPADLIDVNIPPTPNGLEATELPLDILYEDDFLLVICKPAGQVVHRGAGNMQGTVVNALLSHIRTPDFQSMIDQLARPGIVHRLDKDTSGVLLIAKTPAVKEALTEAFKSHEVRKTYLAIVLGEMPASTGSMKDNIGRDVHSRIRMAAVTEGGKEAFTEYQVIGRGGGCTLVKVRLHTGRTHQIRVHFSHAGYPVLGDSLYGGCPREMPWEAERQLLHAWRLRLRHPVTHADLRFQAPLPEDFRAALNALHIHPILTL